MFRQWMMKRLKYHITVYKGIDKPEYNGGSITLEATVFLTLFILFYMVLMSLIQMAKAQIILQYSINEVAKEVSVYSYPLTKTGIVDKCVSTAEQANTFIGKTTETIDAILNVGQTIANGGGGVIEAAQNAGNQINDYLGETDELASNVLSVIKAKGAGVLSGSVIESVCENEMKKQIENFSHKSADVYLRDLGISEGMNGLDFTKTSWGGASLNGFPVLEVTVIYEIDFKLGFFELEPRKFKLSAKTAIW